MKMKTALVLTITTLSSMAFANTALLQTKIERKALRINTMIERGKLENLSRQELRQVLNNLKSAIATIKGQTPVPPRPTPTPSRRLKVDFYLENTLYSLTARNTNQLYNSCLNRLETSISGKYDDIYISVNGSKPVHHHNSSSWWTEAQVICEMVEREAKQRQNDPRHRGHLSVQGRVEKDTFSFQASNPMGIFTQCVEQFPTNIKVDDISVSVNDSRRENLHNSSSWWEGNKTVCTIITNQIK